MSSVLLDRLETGMMRLQKASHSWHRTIHVNYFVFTPDFSSKRYMKKGTEAKAVSGQKKMKSKGKSKIKSIFREFPGGPVSRTPCFHFWGPGFDPWLGKEDPAGCEGQLKKRGCLYAPFMLLHMKSEGWEIWQYCKSWLTLQKSTYAT